MDTDKPPATVTRLRKKLATKRNQEKENKSDGPGERKKKTNYSIDELLDKAEEFIDTFQYQLAQKFCERALNMDSDNLRALELSGVLLLEMDEMEKAKGCFGRAIEIAPSVGHSKYMYMGQLMTGDVAIQCFAKGIEIMRKVLRSQQKKKYASNIEDEVSVRDISRAHCSIAEIYLTDECDDNSAEVRCKENIDAAVDIDSSNAEAYHLMASFWLSKDDKQKAKESIEKGVNLWLPLVREADKSEEAAVDLTEVCEVSYPARLNACKILIEVELHDMATEVLELLLDEDDEVVEVWYLLGWANYLQGEDYKANSRFYLNKAKEVAEKTKFENEEVMKHIEDLLTELGPEEEHESQEEEEEEENIESETEDTSDKENINQESMEH